MCALQDVTKDGVAKGPHPRHLGGENTFGVPHTIMYTAHYGSLCAAFLSPQEEAEDVWRKYLIRAIVGMFVCYCGECVRD